MDDTTPQLTPAEYGITTAETEATPELEPGVDIGEIAEETDFVEPDIEPPTTIGVNSDQEGIEFVEPELSPPHVEISVHEEEEFVAPEELPPSS